MTEDGTTLEPMALPLYESTLAWLSQLRERFDAIGDRVLAAETLWLIACYHERLRLKEESAVFYRSLVRLYPETPASERAAEQLLSLDAHKDSQAR